MEKKPIRACAVGIDQVLNVWQSMNDGHPFFAVFYGIKSSKFFQYNRDDLEGAELFLRNNLSAIADSGDNSQYYLSIYPEAKTNYTGSGEICCFPFRLNPYEEATTVSGVPGFSGGNMDAFSKMFLEAHNKQLEMAKELAELKAVGAPQDWFDRIGGLLETPGAAATIVPILQPVIGAIMGLVTKMAGISQQQPVHYNNPVIAGPAEHTGEVNELIDQQLDRLEKHGELVEMLTVLANFADKNPAMFKMYFDGLKAQA